ncbi:MAG: AAA family ATPase [Gammaproteobacteria bacterium]|nr:AAA family ATPase [Gammaproteobacteria bacterium]
MESSQGSYFKITDEELNEHSRMVDALLKEVRWKSNKLAGPADAKHLDVVHSMMTGGQEIKLSYANIALNIGKLGWAMPEGVNKTYIVVRNGLRIGARVAQLYEKASNLDVMKKERGQSQARQLEFRKKMNTASAVGVFTAACYIVYELSQYRVEEIDSVKMEFENIPELDLTTPIHARNCMLFYYTAYLERSGKVHNELDFIKMTLLYFQGIIDEIKTKADALEYTELFTSKQYKLEHSEFSVSGFEVNMPGQVTSVEFNKVYWNQIVGNTASKHSARRTIQALMCYDPETRANPMADLGGFAKTKCTYGPPGTGKSMEIAAIATELEERCRELQIPFLFTPFPDNIVSTYQGGSSERMLAWMKPLQDPAKIIFAPIDDAENNLEERSNPGVSAGVQEVVGVFLRMTEGAYAVDHGNVLINLYTNIPEKIDKAVLSRVQSRAHMGGAERLEDFYDQDHIGMLQKFEELAPGFIDLAPPKSYRYLSAQSVQGQIEAAYETRSTAKVEKIAEIMQGISAQYPTNSHEFFAHLDVAVKKTFPFYTSRDKRNIQSAVKIRLLDFDFPGEWMENPEVFFRKDYDTKKTMLIDAMRQNLKGKSFSDIYLEESVNYFDNLAKIADQDFERKAARLVEDLRVREEAARRMK